MSLSSTVSITEENRLKKQWMIKKRINHTYTEIERWRKNSVFFGQKYYNSQSKKETASHHFIYSERTRINWESLKSLSKIEEEIPNQTYMKLCLCSLLYIYSVRTTITMFTPQKKCVPSPYVKTSPHNTRCLYFQPFLQPRFWKGNRNDDGNFYRDIQNSPNSIFRPPNTMKNNMRYRALLTTHATDRSNWTHSHPRRHIKRPLPPLSPKKITQPEPLKWALETHIECCT